MTNAPKSYLSLRMRILWLLLVKRKLSVRKLLNVAAAYVAYFMKTSRSGRAPFVVLFELWNECNVNCYFCRTAEGQIYDQNPRCLGGFLPKGRMSYEIYASIIDQLHKYLVMAILYINGEPLLYKDLAKAVRFASDKRVATFVATNGTLLDEKKIDALLDADLDFLKIAISGYTQEIYLKEHRRGDVELVKRNMILLSKKIHERSQRILVMVDWIAYRYNNHEQNLMRSFCEALGFAMNIRQGIVSPGTEDAREGCKVAPAPFLDLREASCEWPWMALAINWSGDLLPCCQYVTWSGVKPYATYRAGETDLMALWNGPVVQQYRHAMARERRKAVPICAECTVRGIYFKY